MLSLILKLLLITCFVTQINHLGDSHETTQNVQQRLETPVHKDREQD